MKKSLLFVAAAFVAAVPAGAAITVIGSSNAKLCYEYAEAEGGANKQMLSRCNAALTEDALEARAIVA